MKLQEKLILGKSIAIDEIKKLIEKVAQTDLPILITGETGTGKELVCQNIHYLSQRKNKPFITINCANISENLFESELFGYKRGAFSDAKMDKIGLIKEANGGTLFFDEISETSIFIQAKLLRVIEHGEVRKLGNTKTHILDTRFIFATNKDLQKEIEKGRFRKDLFFRISLLNIRIPPLRERKGDIPVIVRSILKAEQEKLKEKIGITREAMNKLQLYSYPGNVRELENIVRRAIIFSENNLIKEQDLTFQQEPDLKNRAKYRIPKRGIISALVKHQGNKSKVAKELKISRTHLYRILKRLEE